MNRRPPILPGMWSLLVFHSILEKHKGAQHHQITRIHSLESRIAEFQLSNLRVAKFAMTEAFTVRVHRPAWLQRGFLLFLSSTQLSFGRVSTATSRGSMSDLSRKSFSIAVGVNFAVKHGSLVRGRAKASIRNLGESSSALSKCMSGSKFDAWTVLG